MKYVRFETSDRDRATGTLVGVFQAAYRLRDADALEPELVSWLEEETAWFNAHLPKPGRFSFRSGYRQSRSALCWFKDDAREHLRHACALVAFLEEHGVRVRRRESSRPGYVVYEDAFQVAVVPFHAARRSAPGLGRPGRRKW